MRAKLLVGLALTELVAGCAATRPIGGLVSEARQLRVPTPWSNAAETLPAQTPLGQGAAGPLMLTLPSKPNYPAKETHVQTILGEFDGRKAAFEAVLDLAPERAKLVITAASGPRIMSVTWTKDGLREDRTLLAPPGLSGANALGDIFLALWPADQVALALPEGVQLAQTEGLRRIFTADRTIVAIETSSAAGGVATQALTNYDFDYSLSIVDEAAGG